MTRLLPELGGDRPVSVVFDHNLGGGANQYRRGLIDERLSSGLAVLLCTYNLPTLDYRLQVFQPGGGEEIYRMSSFLGLERILGKSPVREIFLNSPVSFDEPLVFADWISTMRSGSPKLRLTFAVHDYFSVCPSFVLLNADGRYCGIPDVAECADVPATPSGPVRGVDAADRDRALARAVGSLPAGGRRGAVLLRFDAAAAAARLPGPRSRPHQRACPIAWTTCRPACRALDHAAPLVIGIIGQISVQKGALVVKEMLARIESDHPDVRVVVIGALDIALKSDRLRVTGTYRHGELVDLIEANGVNMFFFPSICPETFSYVTEEMILLGVPIVAFDLGAPGERLRSYGKSRLCSEVSARCALAALVDFHAQLAAAEIPAA